MNLDIQPATLADKTILRHMWELYLYDFSEFTGEDLNPNGLFETHYFDLYWLEEDRRFPFLFRVDGNLAGFAFVRLADDPDGRALRHISEFFIMRKYRGKGLGEQAARFMFDRFPGAWSVRQIAANQPARAFWRRVIERYTGGDYSETRADGDSVQHFNNSGASNV